ncbi:MAG: tRNA-uridine aminocarboxypropyltransferase [Pseudomonadota bacterium]
MSRRDNADARCPRCRVHASLCICPLIPRIDTRTRLVLITHRREDRKPTNTGRLAAACLPNSEVIVRGHESSPRAPFVWDASTQPLFLFPHAAAVPIARFAASERPVTLIVPDGTWRQAAKVRNRVAGLRDVPCVSIEPEGGATTAYRLRNETRAEGMATMEAIARALGVLEAGGASVRGALEKVFDAMVERTLWSRGSIDATEVAAGIPPGALRHDPRSGSQFPDKP